MSPPNRAWITRASLVVVTITTSAIVVSAVSRGSKSLHSSANTVDRVRANLLAPVSDSVAAYWTAGEGRAMGMSMTASIHYDDAGRFLFVGRGKVSVAAGFDGTTTWRQTPAGETRILRYADGFQVRLPHWLITGYWISPNAPVTVNESDQKPGRGEATLSVVADGAPFEVTAYVDTQRWLPKRFVVNDYGQDLTIHFDEWQQAGERWVPRAVRMTEGGQESSRFLLKTLLPHDESTTTTYAPPEDTLDITYDAAAAGLVASKRGRWGHHFVRPRINGEEIGWLAFDTGASVTSLEEDVARQLGLEIIGKETSTGIGGTAEQKIALVESIEIGPVRFANIPITVSSLDFSLGISDCEGLLGMDVLRHCVIDYDQRNSVIRLYDPSTYTLPDAVWKPLLDHNGKPLVAMRFEGRDGVFSIDTGNPGAIIISPHTVARYSLLDGRKTRSGSLGGIGGSVAAEKGNLDWVEWGHERFDAVPADFVVKNRGAGADRSRDGIIGTDLLRRYRVVFDMQHGRIAYLSHGVD